uniref:Uncharacterized protein n=1 Tax=Cucumis melo TaxID=3656 RepID=A0A9I9DUN3_CUCME
MAGNKNFDRSGMKEAPSTANPSERHTKIIHSDDPMLEQAQLASLSHNEALPISSEVFGTKGWNPFNFKGNEIPMTYENI